MPRLVLESVGQVFDGTPPVRALHEVSITIDQGEFVSIEGPSGGGKSSLLNIIGLLNRPSDGTYLVGTTDVADIGAAELARLRSDTFAFIFQNFHLLDRRPVIDSVELGMQYRALSAAERRERANDALRAVGLDHLAHQDANKLSGGERQRVAIARALAVGAPVVVADEPTGNLDSASSDAVVASLAALHESGATVVLVTHDSEVGAVAQRRVRLRDGEIVEDVRTASVVATTGRPAPRPPGRPSALRLLDLLRDAVFSVLSRRGRTAGLVGAVVVGVALAVATSGLAQTAEAQVSDTFDAHENRQVTVSSYPVYEPGTTKVVRPLDPDRTEAGLTALAGVDSATVVLSRGMSSVQTARAREPHEVQVYTASSGVVSAAELAVSWASPARTVLGPGEALLGANAAEKLKIGPLVGGPMIMINGTDVQVVGIIEGTPRMPEMLGSVVLSPYDSALFATVEYERALILTAQGAAQQVAAQAPLVIDPVDPGRLDVQAPVDPRTLRAEIEGDVQSMLLGLTAVAVVASIAGLANAMVLSVLERKQEFGLRRAVGARTRHVVGLVLAESTVVGAIGGVLGLVTGLAGILVLTILRQWSPVFEPMLAPLAILGGTLVGILGGVLAATRASRIQPSEALRL